MWTEDNLMVLRPEDQASGRVVPLVESTDTEGGWGAVIVSATEGQGGATHFHRGESEAFFIIEGEVELHGATSVTPIVPGTFVLIPPDVEHGLKILSPTARWLAIWPSALDGLIDELAEATAQGRDDPETIAAIRDRHGVYPGRPAAD